jgi:hypothetical protein
LGVAAFATLHIPRRAGLLSLSLPHQLAALSVQDINVGVNLRDVAEVGNWRFLLYKRSKGKQNWTVAGAISVAMNNLSKEYVLVEVEKSSLVDRFERAVRYAESLNDVRQGRYEVLLVIAPSIYVPALWLRDQIGNDDLFLKIPNTPQFLPSGPVTSDKFVQSLVESKAKLETA